MFDFFISDPHFFHKNIIKYCNRPFSSVDEMNETMIENYNRLVKPKHSVLWCGDCFFAKNKESRKIMTRLNGEKHLVLGNHDSDPFNMVSRGFSSVVDEICLSIAGRKVKICHYDQWEFRSPWDDRYESLRPLVNPDEILIHGHTHQKSPVLLNQLNVGVDAWNFGPVSFDEVKLQIECMRPTIEGNPDIEHLAKYRKLVREKLKTSEILDSKYDKFRSLGWEAEWPQDRSM
jgi:calcineurin-like phosphoesterase family protein